MANQSAVIGQSISTPIREGDRFRMRDGSEWKVIEHRPGGKVELFNKAQARFSTRLAREVRQMERVS